MFHHVSMTYCEKEIVIMTFEQQKVRIISVWNEERVLNAEVSLPRNVPWMECLTLVTMLLNFALLLNGFGGQVTSFHLPPPHVFPTKTFIKPKQEWVQWKWFKKIKNCGQKSFWWDHWYLSFGLWCHVHGFIRFTSKCNTCRPLTEPLFDPLLNKRWWEIIWFRNTIFEPPTSKMCNISRGSFYTVDAIKRFFRVVYRVNNQRRENHFRDTILWAPTTCFMCLDASGNRSVVYLFLDSVSWFLNTELAIFQPRISPFPFRMVSINFYSARPCAVDVKVLEH